MAVAERHASHVPENEHEAPFLEVHVPTNGDQSQYLSSKATCLPCSDDQFFALSASICVDEVSHDDKADFW